MSMMCALWPGLVLWKIGLIVGFVCGFRDRLGFPLKWALMLTTGTLGAETMRGPMVGVCDDVPYLVQDTGGHLYWELWVLIVWREFLFK